MDAQRVGIGGLSGGGLRTVYLAGLDDRVRCAVCVGMMTTWRDFLLNKSHTHTWMIYVPHLATEMDYPDILGMRAPLPALVQNNTEDPLFTLAEMRRADVMLRQVYEKAGAADRYSCSFYGGRAQVRHCDAGGCVRLVRPLVGRLLTHRELERADRQDRCIHRREAQRGRNGEPHESSLPTFHAR